MGLSFDHLLLYTAHFLKLVVDWLKDRWPHKRTNIIPYRAAIAFENIIGTINVSVRFHANNLLETRSWQSFYTIALKLWESSKVCVQMHYLWHISCIIKNTRIEIRYMNIFPKKYDFQCIFKIFQIMGGYIVLELPPVTSIVWEVMPDSLSGITDKES